MLKKLEGLRLFGTAVALAPFGVASVMFTIGSPWVGLFNLAAGTVMVIYGTFADGGDDEEDTDE